jgi:hypothetical protein
VGGRAASVDLQANAERITRENGDECEAADNDGWTRGFLPEVSKVMSVTTAILISLYCREGHEKGGGSLRMAMSGYVRGFGLLKHVHAHGNRELSRLISPRSTCSGVQHRRSKMKSRHSIFRPRFVSSAMFTKIWLLGTDLHKSSLNLLRSLDDGLLLDLAEVPPSMRVLSFGGGVSFASSNVSCASLELSFLFTNLSLNPRRPRGTFGLPSSSRSLDDIELIDGLRPSVLSAASLTGEIAFSDEP